MDPHAGCLDAAMPHGVRFDAELTLHDALFVQSMAQKDEDVILSFNSDFDKAGLKRLRSEL